MYYFLFCILLYVYYVLELAEAFLSVLSYPQVMQLKTIPEDFIVVEQSRHDVLEKGPYLLLEMTKRNITT